MPIVVKYELISSHNSQNRNNYIAQVCNEIILLRVTRIDLLTASFGTFVTNGVICVQVGRVMWPLKFHILQKW